MRGSSPRMTYQLQQPLCLERAQGKFPHRVMLLDRAEKSVDFGAIDAHALDECCGGGKFYIVADEALKLHIDRLTVDVAVEVEQKDFEKTAPSFECAAGADIGRTAMALALQTDPHGVDAFQRLDAAV